MALLSGPWLEYRHLFVMPIGSIFLRGRTPHRGEPITADMLARLADSNTAGRARFGPSCTGVQSSGGSVITPFSVQTQTGIGMKHNYTVYNASSGATPMISVTPGNHIDGTGSSTYIPTLGGTAISPLPAPTLVVSASATMAYFKATTNPQDGTGALPAGAFTALEIDADTGSGLPPNDNTHIYQICAMITVTISGGIAKVVSNEGGVAGSQVYQYCNGPLFGLQ